MVDLNTNSMIITGPAGFSGTVQVPGDKSMTHRALIFSSLALGMSRISNVLTSADCLSTLDCLRRLGVKIELDGVEALVEGRGLYGLIEPDDILDVGNSGTALRVLPAALAGQKGLAVLTGDASIRQRPVGRVIEPLRRMGADIRARDDGRLAPIVVQGGPLKPIEYLLPVASAQVKTAVILAGLLAEGRTTVVEPVVSRDHTEILLRHLGAAVSVEDHKEGRRIIIEGGKEYAAKNIEVPSDFSSAAFFLAAGLLAGAGPVVVEKIGLNATRTGFLDVMRSMGAGVSVRGETEIAGEAVGAVAVERTSLVGVEVGGAIVPRLIDELPLVALLATQAVGRTVVRDAAELRVKETDRIGLVAAELNKMGADVNPTDDGFIIDGPTKLTGVAVDSHGDHRLAMMLAVAALVAVGETVIENAAAVNVSFPGFPSLFSSCLTPPIGDTPTNFY